MKRDMDLIRKLLVVIEENCVPGVPTPISVEGYSEDQIDYHIDLLKETGMIDGSFFVQAQSREFFWNCSLTWAGHDFLDAVRNDSVWSKVKGKLVQVGGDAPIDVIKAVAVKAALELIS